jgi:hypothetical protein
MERPVKVVIALFLLLIVGFFSYTRLKSWHREDIEANVKNEREAWVGKIEELGKEVDTLKEWVTHEKGLAAIEPGVSKKDRETGLPAFSAQPAISCAELERQMAAFFAYLDQREYMAAHDLEGRTYDFFLQTVETLSENPPVITGEMDDLSTLVRNVTHFYRVLGKKRIGLIIDILKNESNRIESIMETFYQWVRMGDTCNSELIPPPPLEIAYRYAGFFLNTLGGRSYLLRRGSRTRVLTSYYSILILDHANDKVKNTYGIDIRPYIDFSFYDIKSQKSLAYQDRYMEKLKTLKQKYKM